ncbi:MAG: exodeoxyribonuclease VII small subunit [Ignavibacteria bacterium]|jgi:exodeoxyribonuclease VII small subunit|nr:exodeoxyribonuclease VII small subunit [Ignavibacteria bacterium]MCU7503183.1 exodeoxyribonuclease VII small subunit [Ignavibacteria bacterium]MCU7518310.1 exodeoxyribonuclease VII small subunit [Ignavibacteria bacterium]
MKKKSEGSFEDMLRRLEEISGMLDNESIGLDEAISLYEEGIELSKTCYSKLKEAEVKVTALRKSLEMDGEPSDDIEE